eukprot:Phypoly_transcript_21616.p1 GENE.Phypoly_transcript_21616~~Phypoly_transcript_21616.p1  ORF type:complete len:166 (+),score=10.27 Phypoly_transcript_21616:108-605(+)
MTTKFIYKYYDAYTDEPTVGKFPSKSWQCETFALYGCPGITANLRIYPMGNIDSRGYTSLYVRFFSSNPTSLMQARLSVQIEGHNNGTIVAAGPIEVTVGPKEQTEFGRGRGWPKFCDMYELFKEPKTIECMITVTKLTEKQGTRDVTTKPLGEQEIVCYRETKR